MDVHARSKGLALFLATLLLSATTSALLAAPSRADETTVSYDTLRTDWDPNEPGLSPSNVSSSDFGQLFATQLNGQVYAQQVIAKGVLLAATENNWVYGLDPVTGAIKWQRNVGAAWPAATIGCGDVAPNVGITATPVVDPDTGTAYFTAKVNDGPTAQSPHWYMHAVDITTGAERPGFPTVIGTGTGFNAKTAMQRPGLLLLGGVVYAAFGSHCDLGPYVGYVAGINAQTGVETALFSTEAGTSSGEAGIWQSGGGLVSDGPGQILFATANGISPAPGPGTSPPSQLAESVVRLQVNADGSLSAKDFFSPVNNTALDRDDEDLGAGGPMAIPDGYGSAAHPHLLVQVGKSGQVFLLDRDNLGGVAQGAGGTDNVLQSIGPYRGVWGHPAFWGGDGGYVYTISNGGPMYAYRLEPDGSGAPSLALVGTSTRIWGWGSGSPVVTSTGTNPGSALVWGVYSSGKSGSAGLLQAYDAVPVNGVMQLRYSVPIGTASKFTVPATDAGRLYIGNRDGIVYGFGRPTSSPLTGTDTDFGFVPTGTSSTKTITVTAAKPLTISNVSASGPFTIDNATPAVGTSLNAGDTEELTITATPTAAGPATGTLGLTTSSGTVTLGLEVDGTAPGVAASPSSLNFGQVPTGGRVTYAVSVMNTDSQPTTVTAATGPSGPFTASLPAAGATIPGGGSIAVPVTYAPTTAGTFSDSVVVTTSTGSATINLSATAVVGAPHLTVSPAVLDFGTITVGSQAQGIATVKNSGNVVLTINKAPPPTAPFTVTNAVSEGQQLSPGAGILVTIGFAPTTPGHFSGSYVLTGNDGSGPQTVRFTGSAVAAGLSAIPAPTNHSWHLNGSAQLAGTQLVLTPASPSLAGDAVYPTPVFGSGLKATFTATISGGTGGNGLAFALLAAANATRSSLGRSGSALGWAPLHGVAVVIGAGATGPANAIGIATGPTRTGSGLVLAASARVSQNLRRGSHVVSVSTTATSVTVRVDGGPALTAHVAVPRSVLLAFTAATGQRTGQHSISGVTITQRTFVEPIVGINRRCADVRGTTTASGTPVVLYTCNGAASERWTLLATKTIRALGECLTMTRGARVNGARVELLTCGGTAAQVWLPLGAGRIENPESGKCLAVLSPIGANRSPLVIETCTSAANERWTLP
ncbi:MAG: choice-of-anchor D domain-containing protein [Marmoricola sp.]